MIRQFSSFHSWGGFSYMHSKRIGISLSNVHNIHDVAKEMLHMHIQFSTFVKKKFRGFSGGSCEGVHRYFSIYHEKTLHSFCQVDTFFVIFSTWHGSFAIRQLIWKSTMKGLETVQHLKPFTVASFILRTSEIYSCFACCSYIIQQHDDIQDININMYIYIYICIPLIM